MSPGVHPNESFSLRREGVIVLVSCYELGHQPIGIAQPLAFLEQAGYAPVGLDIAVEEFDPERFARAEFIGISVPMHTALRLGVRVAEAIRARHPSSHICFYGLYAPLNANYLLQHVADSVIGGEYERPLVQLVQAVERERSDGTGQPLPGIEGVSVRDRISGPVLKRPPLEFPVPSRGSLPPLDRYARLEANGDTALVGYVEASRGCLHTCLHCPIVPVYEGRFFIFPERSVLEDIRRQVGVGARHMTFGDPDFLNGPGHSLNIVRSLHNEFPHLTFDFTAKIEHILKHRDLFPELARSGCLFVISAVESFSDRVLAQLDKGHTRADVLTALDILRSCGITLRPSLVAFTPWTTIDDYLEMFDLVESADLVDAIDPVQFTIRLLIPPGSALLTPAGNEPPPVARFVGPLDQANFQHLWAHPDPRMDQLQQAASATVERAAQMGEDAETTFLALKALACQSAGRALPNQGGDRAVRKRRTAPPRLTEAWYCCAEPTEGQFRVLHTKGYGEV